MFVAANEQGDVGGESVDSVHRTSDRTIDDALFSVGGGRTGRVRAVEWMCIAPVCIQGRCKQSGLSKEKVSRHTVRPGTLGLTLVLLQFHPFDPSSSF